MLADAHNLWHSQEWRASPPISVSFSSNLSLLTTVQLPLLKVWCTSVWSCSDGRITTLNKLRSCPFKVSQRQQTSSENQILIQNGINLPTPAAEMLLTSVLELNCTLKQQSKQWRWVRKDVKCYCKRQQVEHFKSLSDIKLFLMKYLFLHHVFVVDGSSEGNFHETLCCLGKKLWLWREEAMPSRQDLPCCWTTYTKHCGLDHQYSSYENSALPHFFWSLLSINHGEAVTITHTHFWQCHHAMHTSSMSLMGQSQLLLIMTQSIFFPQPFSGSPTSS